MGWSIARGAAGVVRGWFFAYGRHISVYCQDIEEGLLAKGDGVVGMEDQESCVADGHVCAQIFLVLPRTSCRLQCHGQRD
jgi:hypothetical protein